MPPPKTTNSNSEMRPLSSQRSTLPPREKAGLEIRGAFWNTTKIGTRRVPGDLKLRHQSGTCVFTRCRTRRGALQSQGFTIRMLGEPGQDISTYWFIRFSVPVQSCILNCQRCPAMPKSRSRRQGLISPVTISTQSRTSARCAACFDADAQWPFKNDASAGIDF